uniref:Uncharacterized protein n=1 Tax=Anguilla anguilla TaxID=7936 RepID=A0A0E9V8X8_ANGAN
MMDGLIIVKTFQHFYGL